MVEISDKVAKKKKKKITKLANTLSKHYSFDLYRKLTDECEKYGLCFMDDINEETNTLEFWIEDDHWVCEG